MLFLVDKIWCIIYERKEEEHCIIVHHRHLVYDAQSLEYIMLCVVYSMEYVV